MSKTGCDPFMNLKIIFVYYPLSSCVHILLCVPWKGRLPHYLAITLFIGKIHYLLKNFFDCHIFPWNASILFLCCGISWLDICSQNKERNKEKQNTKHKLCDSDISLMQMMKSLWVVQQITASQTEISYAEKVLNILQLVEFDLRICLVLMLIAFYSNSL